MWLRSLIAENFDNELYQILKESVQKPDAARYYIQTIYKYEKFDQRNNVFENPHSSRVRQVIPVIEDVC